MTREAHITFGDDTYEEARLHLRETRSKEPTDREVRALVRYLAEHALKNYTKYRQGKRAEEEAKGVMS